MSPSDDIGETHSSRDRELIEAGERDALELIESAATSSSLIGAIPGYTIIHEIGRGGMGVVYKALQITTKRVVALKVMLAGPFASPITRRRFRREVELAARFKHPAIVRVLESGDVSTGQPYYTMDYVEGVPLDSWVLSTDPDPPSVLRLFQELCDGIDYAHCQGVLHRDLKPSNVLIDEDDKPHILDFGLAKSTDHAPTGDTMTVCVSSPGLVLGTLRYLSPEQAAGTPDQIDARTDVYVLGIMLFEALTGALPFDNAGALSEVSRRIIEDPPIRPRSVSAKVDRDLETIILKALRKEKDHRYQSAEVFGEDIGRYLRNEPILSRRPSVRYVLGKKLAKHRVGCGLAAIGLMLTAALLTTLISLGQRERYRCRSETLSVQYSLEARHKGVSSATAGELFGRCQELPETRLLLAHSMFREGEQKGDNSLVAEARALLEYVPARDPWKWAYEALLSEMPGTPSRSDAEMHFDVPDTAQAWYVRTFATLDLEKAAGYAREAFLRNPDDLLICERIENVARLTGHFDDALRAKRKLIDPQDEPVAWFLYQGDLHLLQRRYLEAVGEYTQAVDYSPTNHDAYRRRAAVYLCLEDYERAVNDYSKAIENAPQDERPWVFYQRASSRWMMGDHEGAAKDYRAFRSEAALRHAYADIRLFLILRDRAHSPRETPVQTDADQIQKETDAALQAARELAPTASWPRRIIECLAGTISPQNLADAADPMDVEQQCEAFYYAGEACLLKDQMTQARNWFEKCVETNLAFDSNRWPPDPMNEYHLAKWRLESLSGNSSTEGRSGPG